MPSTKLTPTDDALKLAFLALRDFDGVAALLDVKPRTLRYHLFAKKEYKSFEVPKRTGGVRIIEAPSGSLKIIQRKLAQVLYAAYKTRGPVHGFARERSILTNSRAHTGCSELANLDLQDFFPSIHFGRVRGMFEGKPYCLPRPAAQALAQICVTREGRLPTGAPTSPIVANMICAPMDSELKAFARAHGCFYTRYADDLTFSTRGRKIDPAVARPTDAGPGWRAGAELASIINRHSFRVNLGKTRIMGRSNRKEVTGVIINAKPNVRRLFIRQIRATLHAWEQYGLDAAQTDFARGHAKKRGAAVPKIGRALRGRIEHVGFIRGRGDSIYIRLLERYLALEPSARGRTAATTSELCIDRTIWLVEGDLTQATAFALNGIGLLTAAHAIDGATINLSRMHLHQYTAALRATLSVRSLLSDPRVDFAVAGHGAPALAPLLRPFVALEVGDSTVLQPGHQVRLVGFPGHNLGDSVTKINATITGTRVLQQVPHFTIDQPIIRGLSGGAVLDGENKVVGIALRGQVAQGSFGENDALSSFVPIHVVLASWRALRAAAASA